MRNKLGQFSEQDIIVRFWSKVNKTEGCWLWVGGLTEEGYGRFTLPGKSKWEPAHRFSYRIHHPLESIINFNVLHKCDIRRCINPGHLFRGTQKDNIRDMISKGRFRGRTSIEAGLSCLKFCKRGHIFDLKNTYYSKRDNSRICRKCKCDSTKKSYWRKKNNDYHRSRSSVWS